MGQHQKVLGQIIYKFLILPQSFILLGEQQTE